MVHGAILRANLEVFREYYVNRYGKPSSISIPPLIHKSHVLPLIADFDNLCAALADNVTFPKISEPSLLQIGHSTGQEEYVLPIPERSHERYIIDSQTGNAAIGCALSARTDTVDVKTPKTFNQAMKSPDSAQ